MFQTQDGLFKVHIVHKKRLRLNGQSLSYSSAVSVMAYTNCEVYSFSTHNLKYIVFFSRFSQNHQKRPF